MSAPVTTAIFLAAGLGSRLQEVHAHSPKGLLMIGGVPLVERSLKLLLEQGIERVIIVTGHMREAYDELATRYPQVEITENPEYATTGSMASLDFALKLVDTDFLLLEADLIYEKRALTTLLGHADGDVVLTSGPTEAGDEVWVQAPDAKLEAMDKDGSQLTAVFGEFVGINRISASLAARMAELFASWVSEHGHGQMSYETDALVQAASEREISVVRVDDLLWGEIDDASHLKRVTGYLWPAIEAQEAQEAA